MDLIFRKCNKCEIELPINKFEKQQYTLADGTLSHAFRKKCTHCRVKENKKRNNKYDLHRKRYWGMSEEKRKEYIKKKSEQNSKRKNISEHRKRWNKSDRGVYLSYMHDCNRRGKLARSIKFELTYDYFINLINDKCFYCDVPNCRGVDRVDSNESYTIKNSVPCCKSCNTMKSDMSLEDFKTHVAKIHDKVNK